MTPHDSPELKKVGIDLHVHTPASADYKGSRDDREYLNLIRAANEYGAAVQTAQKPRGESQESKLVGCVAFTDHNSVEGFRRYRELHRRTQTLRDDLRARDPGNALLTDLEEELKTLESVRLLMGVEIKADPGIHLLVVFHESVEPDKVVEFLEQVYERQYQEFAGKPDPITRWTVEQTLNKIRDSFADKAMVVAPHIDSGGGLYEGLKDYAQVRIAAFKHPAVRALSFNKLETRERVRDLFRKPEYRRSDEVALIQSSDFHGGPGAIVGQTRTDVLVPYGKATFNNIKEALCHASRVRCSVDFVKEEYEKLTTGYFLAQFSSEPNALKFRAADYDKIAAAVSAMLNSEGGVLKLEGTVPSDEEAESSVTRVRDELKCILEPRLQPKPRSFVHRHLRFSPGKVRILARLPRSNHLHASEGIVYVVENKQIRTALPNEIESIVSRNMNDRFGERFEKTLQNVSTDSTLLSKMPRGIPIILGCQEKLLLGIPEAIQTKQIEPTSLRSTEASEQADDLYFRAADETPFGDPQGNTSFLRVTRPPRFEEDYLSFSVPPRFQEHYLRFSIFRSDADNDTLTRCASDKIDHPAIVVFLGGGVGLAEPGYIISHVPALLVQPTGEWAEHVYSLLGWFKSSFFVWYCAVRLGNPDLYLHLRVRPSRIPLPRRLYSDFYRRLDQFARNVLLDEGKFMGEMNRQKKKGTLDSAEREKARVRHNISVDGLHLSFDKEVYGFLGLPDGDSRFIAKTLRDIHMTNFGFLHEPKN